MTLSWGHLRPSESTDTCITCHNSSTTAVTNSNENNLMVGGHHNLRNCIKGCSVGRLKTTDTGTLAQKGRRATESFSFQQTGALVKIIQQVNYLLALSHSWVLNTLLSTCSKENAARATCLLI